MPSRKAHLRALAAMRRQSAATAGEGAAEGEGDESGSERDPDHDHAEEVVDQEELDMEAEDEASKRRHRGRERQVRHRKRLRGIGAQAMAMRAWLRSPSSTESTKADKIAADTAALELVDAAVTVALSTVAKEERAQRAARARKRYREQRVAMEARRGVKAARIGRTLSRDPSIGKLKAMVIAKRRKLATAAVLTPEMRASIARIVAAKEFQPGDIVNGESLGRAEFNELRRDPQELRRFYALDYYLRLHLDEHIPSCTAYKAAAKTVTTANGNPIHWQTVRKWKNDFARRGGRFHPDQRGRHSSTVSFLNDPGIAEQARIWLRTQLRAAKSRSTVSSTDAPLTPPALWNRSKGMEAILSERGLYPSSGLRALCEGEHRESNDCCCSRLLATQPDFSQECSALQHVVEARVALPRTFEPLPFACTTVNTARHICLFLPKFHCELNWIERFWGASKKYCRDHCLYTIAGLRETVPISLSQNMQEIPQHLQGGDDLPVAPLLKQRRWARISRQFMTEYWKGSNACDAVREVACQRSKRHRDTSDRRSKRVEAEMAAMSMGL